jgi:hypothetical protein
LLSSIVRHQQTYKLIYLRSSKNAGTATNKHGTTMKVLKKKITGGDNFT